MRQLAQRKAAKSPDPPDTENMTKLQLCAYLNNNDIEWFCNQPGYRPQLEQLALQKLLARRSSSQLPKALSLNHLKTHVQNSSTQQLCALLKNKNNVDIAIPVASPIEGTAMIIPLVEPTTGTYYDFPDIIRLNDAYNAKVQKTQNGISLHGNKYIRLMDTQRSLKNHTTADQLDLHWVIDDTTPEGNQLAREWGTQLFAPHTWREATAMLQDPLDNAQVPLKDSELFEWSESHRPVNLNLDGEAEEAEQAEGERSVGQKWQRFVAPTTQQENAEASWPRYVEGRPILPMSVEEARTLLSNFEGARVYLERGGRVPVRVLNDFLVDERFGGMDANADSQERLVENAVLVYMWDANRGSSSGGSGLRLSDEQVLSVIESRGLSGFGNVYFREGGRLGVLGVYFGVVEQEDANPFDSDYEYPDIDSDEIEEYRREIEYAVTERQISNSFALTFHDPIDDIWWSFLEQCLNDGYWEGAKKILDNVSFTSRRSKIDASSMTSEARNFITEYIKTYWGTTSLIMCIDQPTEAMQLAAVSRNGRSIAYIDNPSPDVQMAAVRNDYRALGALMINDIEITPSVELEAVKQNGSAIQYIDSPSENVQLEAVKQNSLAIDYIDSPSENVQLEAVKQDGLVIYYIDSPSENVQLEAVKQNSWAIQYIRNAPENVQLEAVKQNSMAVEFISSPSENVQLQAVKKNGFSIDYIDSPSESVQLEAVRQNPLAIRNISEPTENVKIAVVKRAPELLPQSYWFDGVRWSIPISSDDVDNVLTAAVSENGGAIQYVIDRMQKEHDMMPSNETLLAAMEDDPVEAYLQILQRYKYWNSTVPEEVQAYAKELKIYNQPMLLSMISDDES